MAGIRHPHASAGQDRHLPTHLVMCMLVPGCRMIDVPALIWVLASWQKVGTTQTHSLTQKSSPLPPSTPTLHFRPLFSRRRVARRGAAVSPTTFGSFACGALIAYRAASSTSHIQRLTSPSCLPDCKEAGTSESEPRTRQIFFKSPGELSATPPFGLLVPAGAPAETPFMLL